MDVLTLQVPKAIEEMGITTIVFVDDFLGTGGQFEKFFQLWNFDKQMDSVVSHIYAPKSLLIKRG